MNITGFSSPDGNPFSTSCSGCIDIHAKLLFLACKSSNMLIYKFGGSSIQDGDGIKNLGSIVASVQGNLVVVVSALGRTTNALEKLCAASWAKGRTSSGELQEIRRFHEKIVDELEPVEEPETGFRPVKSYYYWPLGAAFALVGLLCIAALLERVVLRYRAGRPAHAG